MASKDKPSPHECPKSAATGPAYLTQILMGAYETGLSTSLEAKLTPEVEPKCEMLSWGPVLTPRQVEAGHSTVKSLTTLFALGPDLLKTCEVASSLRQQGQS